MPSSSRPLTTDPLMTATGELPRCKEPDCNKFINIEQPEQYVGPAEVQLRQLE